MKWIPVINLSTAGNYIVKEKDRFSDGYNRNDMYLSPNGNWYLSKEISEKWPDKKVTINVNSEYLDESITALEEDTAKAFASYISLEDWKPYGTDRWENSDDETASTEALFGMFKDYSGFVSPTPAPLDVMVEALKEIIEADNSILLPSHYAKAKAALSSHTAASEPDK